MAAHAVLATVSDQPGILFGLTKVLAAHQANISHVDIIHHPDRDAEIYLEFSTEGPIDSLVDQFRQVQGVTRVQHRKSERARPLVEKYQDCLVLLV